MATFCLFLLKEFVEINAVNGLCYEVHVAWRYNNDTSESLPQFAINIKEM